MQNRARKNQRMRLSSKRTIQTRPKKNMLANDDNPEDELNLQTDGKIQTGET